MVAWINRWYPDLSILGAILRLRLPGLNSKTRIISSSLLNNHHCQQQQHPSSSSYHHHRFIPPPLFPTAAVAAAPTLTTATVTITATTSRRVTSALLDNINWYNMMNGYAPPEAVRGMTTLDKAKFAVDIIVPTLLVDPKTVDGLLKPLKNHMIGIRGVARVRSVGDCGRRMLLLDPLKYNSAEEAAAVIVNLPALGKFSLDVSSFSTCNVTLSYDNWSAEEVLKSILPNEVESVTGFSVVGHIAHLNLRDGHDPYKSVIGQILLDKHKNLKTVVNKLDSIDNTYRNFAMEILAGEDNTNVTLKENGCLYKFDFAKVYWNSRLGTEHERVVKLLQKNAIVYDVFAGVGPFAVPAAKKCCTVYANDLNPESYKSLRSNMTLNKVKGDFKTYNMDGRAFIKDIVMPDVISRLRNEDKSPMHIVMNLPALAIEFLDAFIDVANHTDMVKLETLQLPTVHCYCFSKATEDYLQDVAQRVNDIFNMEIIQKQNVRKVRNVAPNKEMLCASIDLSWDLIHQTTDGSTAKKCKTDE